MKMKLVTKQQLTAAIIRECHQVGIEDWDWFQHVLPLTPETTVGEIQAWAQANSRWPLVMKVTLTGSGEEASK